LSSTRYIFVLSLVVILVASIIAISIMNDETGIDPVNNQTNSDTKTAQTTSEPSHISDTTNTNTIDFQTSDTQTITPTTSTTSSNDNTDPDYDEEVNYTNLFNGKSASIMDIYNNTKYIWDVLQHRRDYHGANQTLLYFGTDAGHNINRTTSMGMGSLMFPFTMYRITGDDYYLDEMIDLYHRILTFTTQPESLFGANFNRTKAYEYTTGKLFGEIMGYLRFPEMILFHNEEILNYAINYFDRLYPILNKTFLSSKNIPIGLINNDGSPASTTFHVTWNGGLFNTISQFYYLSHITGNDTYKAVSDKILEAIWDYRTSADLIPRAVNVETGGATISSITHYDMAGLLNSVLLAYILMGENKTKGTENYTYYELVDKISSVIADRFWNQNNQRWNYVISSTASSPTTGIAEMYAFYVNIALLAAFSITNNSLILDRVIKDFYTSFMGNHATIPNGVLMNNALVIHSPSTHSRQSVFPANTYVPLIGALIFEITQDMKIFRKVHYHYHNLFEKHKALKGYIRDMYAITLEPYDGYITNHAIIDDWAIINSYFALASVIFPTQNVQLDWGFAPTRILPTTLLTTSPVLHNLNINIAAKTVELLHVFSNDSGQIAINFCNNCYIAEIIVNNDTVYGNFTDTSFFTLNGTHTYLIKFTESSETLISEKLYDQQLDLFKINEKYRQMMFSEIFQTCYREEIELVN
jgi:hypothetical protein